MLRESSSKKTDKSTKDLEIISLLVLIYKIGHSFTWIKHELFGSLHC